MTPELTPEQRRRIPDLFQQAVKLPAVEQRAFVELNADGDDRVFEEVLARLPEAMGSSPAPSGDPQDGHAETDSGDALTGLVVGDCTLRELLGRGGMGVVYEAWQDPPGRLVAVKLLGDALSSPEARYRFQNEARVLGSLKHSAIAQIHRSGTHRGTTELPYFVMEYVPDARPITAYVHDAGLALPDVLRLLAEVCRGVHAGHVRGVIHRDLKPANILVGGDGCPKVIDFGIARLMEEDPSAEAPRTRTAQLMGTLTYMSPEQLGGQANPIDTRSDVYALGVVLYQSLTGALPYDLTDLGLVETVGAIRNRPPVPPERFRPDIPRDVRVIIHKALAKEADARYGSAEALADDIERYLDSRPILARAPSLAYQLRLYARRHRIAFLAMAGGLLTLIASLVVISIFAASEARARKQFEREEARARALLHESAGFIPEIADHLDNKLGSLLGATRVRRLLAEKVEGLVERLAALEGASGDPVVLRALGAAEMSVGHIKGGASGPNSGDEGAAAAYYARAIQHLAQAHAARPKDDDLLEALLGARLTLAGQHAAAGRIEEARGILTAVEPALVGLVSRRPDRWEVTGIRMDFLRTRANADWFDDEFDAALQGYREVLVLVERFDWSQFGAAKRDRLLLQTQLDLASAYDALGRAEEAQDHTKEVVRLAELVRGSEPGHTRMWLLWHVQDKLGDLAFGRGDYESARRHYGNELDIAQQLAAGDAQDAEAQIYVQGSEGNLSLALERLERFEEAEVLGRSSLQRVRAARTAQPANLNLEWDERIGLTRLGAVLYRLGKFEGSRDCLKAAHAIQDARLRRMKDDAGEACGLAEVESTLGFLCAAEAEVEVPAQADRTEHAKMMLDRYQAAVVWFDAALARVKEVQANGKLPPGFASNLELWTRVITILRERVAKLRG